MSCWAHISLEDFREKNVFLEIGPFRKLANTFFSIKDINWIFTQIFLILKPNISNRNQII